MAVILIVLMWAAPVWAAVPAQLPQKDKGILQWVIGILLLFVVCLPGGMNAKRTHQT